MLREKLISQMKKGKKLDPSEQEAKLGVLHDLRSQASSMMGDKVKGMKKVTVASDSEEGLHEGLDKADEMINKFGASDDASDNDKSAIMKAQKEVHSKANDKEPDGLGQKGEEAEEELHEDLDHDHEAGESAAHKAKVFGGHSSMVDDIGDKSPEDCSPEELDQKIKELMDLKKSKQMPKGY